MNIISYISKITSVSWLKTLYFNFHYFEFKVAIHLPILIYRSTKLLRLGGTIELQCPIKIGTVKIGKYNVGSLDINYDRTIWQSDGTVIFGKNVDIGSGTRLSINSGSILKFGNNFCLTGASSIICQKEITFGDNCLLSWDILIMDTDFHRIYNEKHELINTPKAIHVGNHVWIGCRNLILKGVNIADNVIVAASSKITKDVDETFCIVGGVDNMRILKVNTHWSL